MAGLEPARAFYGPTDFKSVASAISPHRHDRPHFTLVRAQTKIFHSTITYSTKIPAAQLLQQTRCAIWVLLPSERTGVQPPSAHGYLFSHGSNDVRTMEVKSRFVGARWTHQLNLCDHSCSHLLRSWSRSGVATFAALPEIHQLH